MISSLAFYFVVIIIIFFNPMQSRFFFSSIVFTQSYCSHSLVVLSCLSWLCCLSFLRCSVVLIYPDCVVFFVQDCVQFVYQDHVALFIRILLFCYRFLLFVCSNSELSPHSVLSSHQDFVFVFIYLDCVVFPSSDNIALHHRLCLFVYPDCVYLSIRIVFICLSGLCLFVYPDCVYLSIRIVFICLSGLCLFVYPDCVYLSIQIVFICLSGLCLFVYPDCVYLSIRIVFICLSGLCLFVYPDCVVCISELIVFSVLIKLFVSPDCILYFSIVLFCPRSGFWYFGFPYCVVLYVLVVMLSFIIVLIRLSWLCCFVSANCVVLYFSVQLFIFTSIQGRGRRGRDRMVDGFTTTYAISFLSPLIWWVQISIRARCTTLGDKVCQWLVTGRWFSPGPAVSSTNKTDRHDIMVILLKVASNTIKPNQSVQYIRSEKVAIQM